MQIPAFCESCERIFPSGISGENTVGSIGRCRAGPCPFCGGYGSVLTGTFAVTKDAIRLISGTARSVEQFKSLQRLLAAAEKDRASPQQIVTKIENEAPEWKAFANFISTYFKPKNAGEVYSLIGAVLAAIPLLIALQSKPDKPSLSDDQITVIVEKAVETAMTKSGQQKQQNQVALARPAKNQKIGRNDLCPCGSAKKHKKCCGKSVPTSAR